MSAYSAYKTYCAVTAHFTCPYDYIEQKGVTNQNYTHFEKRKDKHFFARVSKKYRTDEYCAFFVSNFAERTSWIGDLVMDEGSHEVYQGWKGKMQNLTHHVTSEMTSIKRFIEVRGLKKEDLFRYDGKKLPIILRLCMQNVISKETFLAMNRAMQFIDHFDKVCGEDIIYQTHIDILKDYDSFLSFHNIKDIKKHLLTIFIDASKCELENTTNTTNYN